MEEQRRAARLRFQEHVELDGPGLPARLGVSSLNVSEGGVCLRLQAALEIRSAVRLRLFPSADQRPVQCAGRVAWVVQRLDLRDAPPFVYDIGVEFVNPSGRLRELVSSLGVTPRTMERPAASKGVTRSALQPVAVCGRSYVPKLEQETRPESRWHLVVMVDGMPCFGHRYASRQDALFGWREFKRLTARSPAGKARR